MILAKVFCFMHLPNIWKIYVMNSFKARWRLYVQIHCKAQVLGFHLPSAWKSKYFSKTNMRNSFLSKLLRQIPTIILSSASFCYFRLIPAYYSWFPLNPGSSISFQFVPYDASLLQRVLSFRLYECSSKRNVFL